MIRLQRELAVVSLVFLASCSTIPRGSIESQSESTGSDDNPLAYLRVIDPAASTEFFEANHRLFDYDHEDPLDTQEISNRVEDGLTVVDITYASPNGGRVPATLLVPDGEGPFAGLVMMRSMELEFGMKYAACGAVVVYVDPPSFRLQNAGERGILTFTEQDREEQIQLIIDLRGAIDLMMARSDVDPDRIAYLGVSYGGAMGGLLAGVEDRLKAYVLIVGDGGLVTHVTNTKNLTMSLEEFSEDNDAWIRDMWPIEPIHFIARASPTPILFQNATRDQYIDVEDAIRYQDSASGPKHIIWYDSVHWPLPDEVVKDSIEWLQQFIGLEVSSFIPSPNDRVSGISILGA